MELLLRRSIKPIIRYFSITVSIYFRKYGNCRERNKEEEISMKKLQGKFNRKETKEALLKH